MLADTDAGSLITAAQSGAQWGYRLLLLQFLLDSHPLSRAGADGRLGVVTGKGHAELISAHFGPFWAWVSVGTLVVSCLGALLTEFSGLTGVGALIGVPAPVTLALAVTLLLAMAFTHRYLTVERIAIGVGAFELVFLVVAWLAHPDPPGGGRRARFRSRWRDGQYLYLVSANIGAVIMPWMVFFQQSSVVENKLSVADLKAARLDTALGALVTQLVMAAALVATAATLGKRGGGPSLDTVQEIAAAITPFLGEFGGKLLFGLGMVGASLVATIVVTLTAARTVAETLGQPNSLDHSPRQAPWFYGAYAAALILGAVDRLGAGQSGGAQRGGAGDERAAAADRGRLPVPAGAPPARALSLQGRLCAGGDGSDGGRRRLRRCLGDRRHLGLSRRLGRAPSCGLG